MQVNFPALQSLNTGVTLAYNTQFFSQKSFYKTFTSETDSTGDQELYPRLDMIGGLREWIGDRVVESLSLSQFAIVNKEYEKTIGVPRVNVEDDKYGFLTTAAMQLGQNAAKLPDLLIAGLMNNGHNTLAIDGQNFFDTAHPNFTASGGVGTNANYQAGSGPSWYLFDNSQVLRCFIFQRRRPFQIIPKFSMSDENVFWNKEFLWGVDGRCNAGYGLWQLGFRSDAALTLANLTAARTAMAQWRRPDGSPMGISPTHLVTGTQLSMTAKALCENEFLPPGDPAVSSGGIVANTFRGMAQFMENPWIA